MRVMLPLYIMVAAVASAAGYIVEGQGTAATPILGVLKRNILQRGYNV